MKKPIASFLSTTIALAGCATASKDIATSYVSPVQFQAYSCEQLASESGRLTSRVNQLTGRLDQAASNDQTIGVVGALLFWPALFALGGTKQQEAEYARLKGEYDAIQQAAIAKKCSSVVVAPVQVEALKRVDGSTGQVEVTGTATKPPTNEERLQELKRLFDAGLISQEVYAEQQKAVLSSCRGTNGQLC